MGDAIVWTTILAAIHNDGIIDENEKAEAIKLTHVRASNSEPFLKPVYSHLDEHFERDFDSYTSMLSGNQEEKEAMIQSKLNDALEIMPIIGPIYSERFAKSLEGLYLRVFHANSSVFQNFMLPMLTTQLKKTGLK